MSVALLSRLSKAVSVSDELEAFFHVLLYYAIRYLHSNCPDVPNWIEDFFDSYTLEAGEYRCGSKKRETMQLTGMLSLNSQSPLTQMLKFNSPLDSLLSTLLERFHAHYRVEAHNQARQSAAALRSSVKKLSIPTVAPSTSESLNAKKIVARKLPFDANAEGYDMSANAQPARLHATVRRLTVADKKLADMVTKHESMLIALHSVLTPGTAWSQGGDKVGDRVPKEWRSKRPVGPIGRSTIVGDNVDTNKRLKAGPNFASLPIPPSLQQKPETPKKKEEERIARRTGLRSGAAWKRK